MSTQRRSRPSLKIENELHGPHNGLCALEGGGVHTIRPSFDCIGSCASRPVPKKATRPEYSTQQPPWVDPATFARVRLYRASKDQEAADDVTQRAPGSDPAPDRSAERGPPEDWGAEDETQMPTVELRGLAHEPVFPAGAGMNLITSVSNHKLSTGVPRRRGDEPQSTLHRRCICRLCSPQARG